MKHKQSRWLLAILALALFELTGCSRQHYRVRADNDAYGRVLEKSARKPWMPPSDFSVYPAPNSRLYDPTPVNDPRLPVPSPQLYDYELPQLPRRDNARFRPEIAVDKADGQESYPKPVDSQENSVSEPATDERAIPPTPVPAPFRTVSFQPQNEPRDEPIANSGVAYTGGVSPRMTRLPVEDNRLLAQASQTPEPLEPAVPQTSRNAPSQAENDNVSTLDEALLLEEGFRDSTQLNQVPLPESYWEAIPPDCLSRTFEFASVRDEYAATFGAAPRQSQLDDSPKLALEDIIDLTLLNSRELQTQKEVLYRVALVLTLERFDYQLKPSVGNNGTATDFTHDRSGGNTVNTLRIPTTFQLEKMLYTGGDFIGRFANRVLLTFNGPQGFAVDVGSDLLFDFSQSLLQRDVRLENLTSAERNVVYAARDFTRFRKELFVQQATDYYSLIRQFRQIEINCQNYFTLAREFNQRSVEIKFGIAARTELDQVEQRVISSRQSILSACTSLENALDGLKIRMGIPTEQPLNLDLSELNLLTLRDELAVNAELLKRTLERINREINSETRSAFVIVGAVGQLAEQMLDSLRLRKELGDDPPDAAPLEQRLLELRVEAADINVEEDRTDLDEELQEEAPDPTKVVQRRRDVADELLKKVSWQIRLLQRHSDGVTRSDELLEQFRQLRRRLEDLEVHFLEVIFREQEEEAADENAEELLGREAATLQQDLQSMTDELDRSLGRPSTQQRRSFEDRALSFADELMRESENFREGAGGGLVPLEIDMDDAMMTALVQRFDLMNERGFLADDWRQIKFAADDLRSVLNLRATQLIRTRSLGAENKPFDFTFDDSNTAVSMTLDLPFNRRAQRNRFRSSLFDYQAALRRVMQLEDNIKFSVRRDLRTLTLDRQQYANDIAGAALASERVTGTELEVRGGFATSRDFLEAQTAYVLSVSGVAERHINYIVGRLQLFLDLESLTVGDDGFWSELYDENHQPVPYYQLPEYARPGYGELHPRLKYSPKIRRMQHIPDGMSMMRVEDDSNRDAQPPR